MRVLPNFVLLCSTFGLLGAFTVAQAQQTQQSPHSPHPPYVFSLVITTPGTTVKTGSDISVRITMTNTSNQDIFYGAGLAGESPFGLEIRDSDGNLLSRIPKHKGPSPGESGSFVLLPIAPGKSIQKEVILNKDFDMTNPGSYTVQATREAGYTNPSAPILVRSNKLTITVTP